jgi:2,4-dienoyl-CoA reductase-like NADH-dependent reductase (Old Yellow Enzyme family)
MVSVRAIQLDELERRERPMLLGSPFRLSASGRALPNRIGKAAMSEGLSSLAGAPTPALTRLYRRFAAGNPGLIITGNVAVDARFLERPGNVVVEDERHLAALMEMATAAKERGALCLAQISHAGRQTQRFTYSSPVAPSAGAAVNVMHGFARPRALSGAEVVDVVARFTRSARVLERAGFDGVQLHAAHGYLLSQFLSPLLNRRTDEWGGDLRGRARVLIEIVRCIRRACGPRFVVAVKVNSNDFQRGGFEGDEAATLLGMLEHEGVDLVEISGGNYESPAQLFGVPSAREAYFLAFAEEARTVTKLPLMLTGGFRTRAAMHAALASGAVDVIGLARPVALDPDAPRKLLDGTSDRLDLPPVPSGKRPWHGLAESAFFGAQLLRLGQGREADPGASSTLALVRQVAGDVVLAYRRRLRGIPDRPRWPDDREANEERPVGERRPDHAPFPDVPQPSE